MYFMPILFKKRLNKVLSNQEVPYNYEAYLASGTP